MKNVMKLGSFESAVVLPDDAVTRLGSLGVVVGGLLALVVLLLF